MIRRFYLGFFLCLIFTKLNGQNIFDVPIEFDKAVSDTHVKTVNEGLFLVFELKESLEVILLNNDFQKINGTTLSIPVRSSNFIGIRETDLNYFIYTEIEDSGAFLSEIKIEKSTFSTSEQVYNLSTDGYETFDNFILNNDIFSISSDQGNKIFKVLRSNNSDKLVEFSYMMNEKDIGLFKRRSGLFSSGVLSIDEIDNSIEHSIYDTHNSYKFFTDNKGQLILSIDKKEKSGDNMRILQFSNEPVQNSYSKFEEKFMPRMIASGLHYSANSFIYNDYVFSLAINGDAVMLDILTLESLKPVLSLSSIQEDKSRSIQPEILFQEGAYSMLAKSEKSFDKPKKIMNKISRGQAGLVVAKRDGYLEVTIGTFNQPSSGGGIMVGGVNGMPVTYIPGYTYGDGVTYFYRVKLDAETFESLGTINIERDIDKVNDYLQKDKSLDMESYGKGRILFEFQGAYFIGYQQKDTRKYKIWKAI